MNFDGQLLAAAVEELGGREYGRASVDLDNLHSRHRTQTDCSIAVAAILGTLYGDNEVAGEWDALMIQDGTQPFSPVEACVRRGIARDVAEPTPGRWHVVQGWRVLDAKGHVPIPSPRPNGHSFLYREIEVPLRGSGLVVNANTKRPWIEPKTWGEVAGRYQAGIRLAVLVVP